MRKTKIICTLGPACDDEGILEQMCLAGMNVARLNFSHGTHADHLKKIEMVKRVRKKLGLPIAILLDTKGPEYRIKTFANGKAVLKEGDRFVFTSREVEGDEHCVGVNYARLAKDLEVGDTVLLNNGLMRFRVEELTRTDVICRVEIGGELSNQKSMSFPGKVLKQPYFSEQDQKDILFGIENDVDFIACSFVSCRDDVEQVKKFVTAHGGANVDIIAKIENRSGVENFREICEACEGIMVARGDMGVEIPFEELPAIQKHLITECRLLGKRVITATEMLESMIHNSRPTRAEISDVANAVYDGTSAIMLSGETAAGQYPVLTVETMSKIAREAEQHIDYEHLFLTSKFKIKNTVDAISHATCGMAIDIGAKCIAVCSMSGSTVRMVSRFRSPVDILGLTVSEKTWRKLALSWGVLPVLCDEVYESIDVLFYTAKRIARERFALQKNDRIVITGGASGSSGSTNLIKVETV